MNEFITTPLSIDHISFDKSEIAKVQAEHPGKESVVNEKMDVRLVWCLQEALGTECGNGQRK